MQLSLSNCRQAGRRTKCLRARSRLMGRSRLVKAAERAGVGGAIGAGVGLIAGAFGHHKKAGAIAGGTGGAIIGGVTTKVEPAKAKPEQLLHFKLMKPLNVAG